MKKKTKENDKNVVLKCLHALDCVDRRRRWPVWWPCPLVVYIRQSNRPKILLHY